ncbi:MAG TPA: family 78 glycoside hydrolase catalytic domain, partial [Polyangiaceae bacterium]|nr:family 78 glycoside hydrolase catalytic domain [Polyangiaceae bacterium]
MSRIQATRLRTEYLDNPLGIGVSSPRLFWWVDDPRPGARQRAYRIRAATSQERLATPDIWDSGKIESKQQAQLVLGGKPLESRQRVSWDVALWDADDDAGPVSQPACFELGLLERSDWSAQFIATPLEGTGQVGAPSPMLRKAFELPGKIASARLYITALGLYEASLNGRRVGDLWLRPGWTDYHKRLNYQTYDVTSLLEPGTNAIGAMLGDGWYCGRVAALDRAMVWGTRPALLAQLEVTLSDGSILRVVTDESWRWQVGPVLNSDLIHGEEYDARREVQGWDLASFDDASWQPVSVEKFPEIVLEPSMAPPVRALQEIAPIADPKPTPAGWERQAVTFDFGQNLTGVLRLRVRGPAGQTLVIRHAEALKADGSIDVSNLRSARAIDHYTLRGDPAGETFVPRFTLHGFRYAEISTSNRTPDGKDGAKLTRDSATAVVLASDTADTGSFECDHALVNKLQSNIRWGMRGNFIEVPTDCPQRDERLGWTGDTQVFAPTAAFNADVAGFYSKWMRDLADAQLVSGAVPAVVPKPGERWNWDGEAGWADATVVVPWATYLAYGDGRILEQSYGAMRRWIAYLTETSRDGIRGYVGRTGHNGFGDWLALDGPGSNPGQSATPKDFIATAHYAESLRIISNVARVLGHATEADAYAEQRQAVVLAFNREFVTAAGRLAAPSQTAHLLALAFDLLPERFRPAAVEQLVQLIREREWHLTTGFLGTPLLCPVLTRFGRADVAY